MKIKAKLISVKTDKAERWWQNGDHSKDDYIKGICNEGKLVRRYRTPEGDGWETCSDCGYIMHDHGWIDVPEYGHTVCPGDWIIENENGEFLPCKPDIFKIKYVCLTEEKDVNDGL